MNRKGFSLIELQVCCVIMAVLAAIGGPFFLKTIQRQALGEEMRNMYFHMQQAKAEAAKTNSYVVFQLVDGGYSIFVDNGAEGGKNADWIRQPGERQLVSHRYQKGIKMSNTTFTANRTRFSGTAGVKAGRVVLEDSEGRKSELIMNISSRIRIAELIGD